MFMLDWKIPNSLRWHDISQCNHVLINRTERRVATYEQKSEKELFELKATENFLETDSITRALKSKKMT